MPEVSIKLSAEVDQAAADIKRINEALGATGKAANQTGLSLTDLKSGLDMAVGGVKLAAAAMHALIDPTIKAAGEVREMQRTIGATAEEASKLIQAADDVGISAGTLQGAMEAAIKKGVRPTIEGMGELADQYNAIQDPIERTRFLQDNFGRSGAQLAPLMAQGREGIEALGKAAENTGLVLSQDAVDAAREYELSVDALGDASSGYFSLIAQDGIPILTDLNNTLAEGIGLTNQLTVARRAGILSDVEAASVAEAVKWGYFDVGGAAEYVQEKMDDAANATDAWAARLQGLADDVMADRAVNATDAWAGRLQGLADALGVTTDANYELVTAADLTAIAQDEAAAASGRLNMILGGAVGNEIASYEQSQADLAEQIDATRAELEKYTTLSGQTYTVITDTEDAQRNLTIAMAGQETAAGTLSEAQQKLSENTDPDKQLQLEAAVARAEQALGTAEGKVGEWNAALAESGGVYVTDYTTKINEITGELYTLEEAAAANAAAHELATEKILFGYIQQALAVDGLTLTEIKALTGIATQWGLLDADTAAAVDGILEAADELENDGSVAGFMNQVNDARDAILGVPTDINVNFHLNTTGHLPLGAVPTYTSADARASGGPVSAGTPYLVGERGPEIFMPSSNGGVMNNSDSADLVGSLKAIAQALSSGGNTNNQVNNYYGVGGDMAAGYASAVAGAY